MGERWLEQSLHPSPRSLERLPVYGFNSEIVALKITLTGENSIRLEPTDGPMTIVGVARAGFNGVQVGQMPDVFIPMAMKAQMTPDWNGLDDPKDYWLAMIGRIKPGLSRAQGEAAVATIYRQILEEQLPQQGKLSPEQVTATSLAFTGRCGRLGRTRT